MAKLSVSLNYGSQYISRDFDMDLIDDVLDAISDMVDFIDFEEYVEDCK